MRVVIYVGGQWTGWARGGREGRLRGWSVDRLPFDQLWPDMRFWLPLVLADDTAHGSCVDAAGNDLRAHRLQLERPA